MSEITFEDIVAKLPALGRYPRVELVGNATPIEPMRGTSRVLAQQILIKRDDLLPFAFGGNKVRQLEYYLGQAQSEGADTILITGAVQSNFVRLCAAATRKMGWHPVVQLENRVPNDDPSYNNSGNVLLLKMLGAEIHNFPDGEDEAAADANLDQIAAGLRTKGAKPYVIHLGIEHSPLGGLGYAAAAVEAYLQSEASGAFPDCVVIPSGSGLTHAGFLAGARAIGWDVPVLGICVRRDAGQQHQRITLRAHELAKMLGGVKITPADIDVSDAVLAPGYGKMNQQVLEAISLAARSDAIILDPVYSGRTLSGLISHKNRGKITPLQQILLVHTGGTAAIFAYERELSAQDAASFSSSDDW